VAKKTKILNLGTKRESDHDLSPHELPTNRVPGEKPPYQITEGTPLVHSFREQQMTGCGLDPVDRSMYPDPHVLEQDIAHSQTPLSSQHRPAVRENFGGGAGETKVSRVKRGGLQTPRDTPAKRAENKK